MAQAGRIVQLPLHNPNPLAADRAEGLKIGATPGTGRTSKTRRSPSSQTGRSKERPSPLPDLLPETKKDSKKAPSHRAPPAEPEWDSQKALPPPPAAPSDGSDKAELLLQELANTLSRSDQPLDAQVQTVLTKVSIKPPDPSQQMQSANSRLKNAREHLINQKRPSRTSIAIGVHFLPRRSRDGRHTRPSLPKRTKSCKKRSMLPQWPSRMPQGFLRNLSRSPRSPRLQGDHPQEISDDELLSEAIRLQ